MLACYRPPRRPMRKAAAAPINIDKVGAQLLDVIHVSEEQCKRKAHEAYARADFSLQKLAGILGQAGMPGRESIERVTHAVYGTPGDAVLECVDMSYPVRTKYAAVEKPLPADHPFFAAMDDAIKKIDAAGKAYAQRDMVLQKCANAHAKYKDQWKTVLYGNEIERLVLTPAQAKEAELKKKIKTAADKPEEEEEPAWSEILTNPVIRAANDKEKGIASVLDADEHRSKLRNIMTETMFTDLLNTDEELKRYDPEEVLEAYNDVVEANPYLVGKKMLLRSTLRQYLASDVLDLPTIAQLSTLNEQARKRVDNVRKETIGNVSALADAKYKRQMDNLKFEMARSEARRDERMNALKTKAMEAANKIKEQERKDTAAKNKAEAASRNQTERLRHTLAVAGEERARASFPFEMARNMRAYDQLRTMAAGGTIQIPGAGTNWDDVTPADAIGTWRGIGVPTNARGREVPLPTFKDIKLGG